MQSQNNIIAQNNPNKKINTTVNNKKNNFTANRSISLPPARTNGPTTQACAACKYQRRKCASDCILAPYFPHDRQLQFLNAHRLFGVSNIVKIIRHLDPTARDHAMRTIMFQSDARAVDPIGGCYRIICDLEQRLALANAEFEIVLHQLALCREATSARHEQQVVPPNVEDHSTIIGDPLGSYNEKLGEQYATEDGVVADDVNSWCMPEDHVNANASTTSSSFDPPHDHVRRLSMEDPHHDHVRRLSMEDQCNQVLENDVQPYGELKFDQGDIITSNNDIFNEDNAAIFKEEDVCNFPYNIQDHQYHLNSAATFFTLANCDF